MTCGVYWEDKKAGSGMGMVFESNTQHRDAQEGEAETVIPGGSDLGFGGDAIPTVGLPPIEGEGEVTCVVAACAPTWEEKGARRNPIGAALVVASKEGEEDCRRPAGKGGPWRRS